MKSLLFMEKNVKVEDCPKVLKCTHCLVHFCSSWESLVKLNPAIKTSNYMHLSLYIYIYVYIFIKFIKIYIIYI